MNQKQARADELFFVVDKHDQPLAPLPRRLVHGHGVWHRVAHVWLVNSKREVLCQQRSKDKELHPGYWEAFFGGHIGPGESYEAAAQRELEEELGIELPPESFRLWKVHKRPDTTGYNNEFQGIFVADWDGTEQELHFKDSEVERTAWIPTDSVVRALSHEDKWVHIGYELELLAEVGEWYGGQHD